MDKQGQNIRVIGLASNGANEQAGIITRDWNPSDKPGVKHLINAVVFPDCATPFTRGSIEFHIDEQDARTAYAAEGNSKMPHAWLVETSVSQVIVGDVSISGQLTRDQE